MFFSRLKHFVSYVLRVTRRRVKETEHMRCLKALCADTLPKLARNVRTGDNTSGGLGSSLFLEPGQKCVDDQPCRDASLGFLVARPKQ